LKIQGLVTGVSKIVLFTPVFFVMMQLEALLFMFFVLYLPCQQVSLLKF